MILADAHLHLFRHGFPGVYGRSLLPTEIDVYEAFRAKHGVAAGLIVGYQGDGIDPGQQRLYPRARRHPPVDGDARLCRAGREPSPATVEALMAAGHAGLAVYVPDDRAVAALGVGRRDVAALDALAAIVSFNVGLPQVRTLGRSRTPRLAAG